MKQTRDLSELSVLARRGELTRVEEQELAEALRFAPEERFLHEAGRGFDLETSVLVGDEHLIERVTQELKRPHPPRPLLARWRFASGVAAGLLLAATGALGVELARSMLSPSREVLPSAPSARPAAPPNPVPSPKLASPRTPESGRSALEEPSEPAPRLLPQPHEAVPKAPRLFSPSRDSGRDTSPAEAEMAGSRAASAVSAAGVAVADAEELFVSANRARSRGDTALAMALYRQLQTEHASSAEASASRLSLGMLQLSRSEPAEALEQFRLYRQNNPQTMTAEALFGQAEAHRQLGQRNDERRVLEELTTRYPQSAYAVAAAKRLGRDE